MKDAVRPVSDAPAVVSIPAGDGTAPTPASDGQRVPAITPDKLEESGALVGPVPVATGLVADSAGPKDRKSVTERKGNAWASWGYNRAFYGPSSIHFTSANEGQLYDFTLNNVRASDRPTFKSTGEFLKGVWREEPTIPQYNLRMGYFIDDNTSVSVGIDHMKYVMDKNQPSSISGTISPEYNAELAGENFHNKPVTVGTAGSIVGNFEHTNGFNLVDAEISRFHTLAQSADGRHAVSVFGTVGAGVIIPKSDVTMMGKQLDNRFHLAGWGASAAGGLRAEVFRYGFIEGKLKAGYVDVMNALTVEGGKAQHTVGYLQPSFAVGVNVPISGSQR